MEHRAAAPYGELARLTGSPVVELNRAIAVAETDGPESGLPIIDGLASTASATCIRPVPNSCGGSDAPTRREPPIGGRGTAPTTARPPLPRTPADRTGRHVGLVSLGAVPLAENGDAARLSYAVRQNEEVIPMNESTWVLLSGVTVGR